MTVKCCTNLLDVGNLYSPMLESGNTLVVLPVEYWLKKLSSFLNRRKQPTYIISFFMLYPLLSKGDQLHNIDLLYITLFSPEHSLKIPDLIEAVCGCRRLCLELLAKSGPGLVCTLPKHREKDCNIWLDKMLMRWLA